MLELISVGFASAMLLATGKAMDKATEEDEEEEYHRTLVWKQALAVAIVIIIIVSVAGAVVYYYKPSTHVNIILYGYSVKGEVMDGKVIPAFKAYWKNKTGETVTFQTVYAGSGAITKQVISGAPAKVMILATEWDALQLKKNGFITTDWNKFPHNATISTSPFLILTRNGNPKNITDFQDMGSKNIKTVSADPATSGGACWSIFGIYGSELRRTNNTTAADALVTTIVKNIIAYQSSARDALTYFTLGFGDALITYESDALLANKQGKDLTLVYPKSTISSEHKIVMIDKNVNASERKVVQAFIDYMYTEQTQKYFTQYGFHSVDENLNQGHPEFGTIQDPFYVTYLGGWEKAHADLIDGVFKSARNP